MIDPIQETPKLPIFVLHDLAMESFLMMFLAFSQNQEAGITREDHVHLSKETEVGQGEVRGVIG